MKHNMTKTKLYQTWARMINRCYCKSSTRYNRYGDRGIKVCDEWRGKNGSINFINWAMANGFKENIINGRNTCSLDRINPNDDYTPENCRFADDYIQARNRPMRSTNKSGHRGVYWCKEMKKWTANISYNNKTIYLGRYNSIDDAITARKLAEEKYWQ